MNRYRRIFLPTLALFAIGGALTFSQNGAAQETDGPPPPDGPHPIRGEFRGPERLFARLNLSADQKTQMRTLHENARTASRPYVERLIVIDRELREAVANGTFDETAVRAIAARKAEIEIELTVIHVRMRAATFSLLTPEQKSRLNELHKNRSEFSPAGKSQDEKPDFP
jgi:protein CpxP